MIKTYRTPYVVLLVVVAALQLLAIFLRSPEDSNFLWTGIHVILFMLHIVILWFFSKNLKRNETHSHALLNSLEEMVLICNEKGEIQYSNHLLKKISDLPIDRFPSVFSKEWEEHLVMETISGDPLPVEQRPFVRTLRGESVTNEEIRLGFKSLASDRIVSVTGKALYNALGKTIGAILIMKDITLLKEEEQHRIRLAKILEATSDFVGTADKDGKVVYINKAGLKLIGQESFTDLNLRELHPASAIEIIEKKGIPTAISKGIWQGETALLNRSGQAVPVSQVILSHKLDNEEVEFLSTIARDISDIKEAEEKILHMARHDDLTGLLNRRGFTEFAVSRLRSLEELQLQAAVLYFDLDGFKKVNDLYGHQAGDLLLQQVGKKIAAITDKADLASRLGGDEFALLIMESDIEEIRWKAKELQSLFLTPLHVEGHEVNIAMSIGISLYPMDGRTIESLLKKADHAMYVSKSNGKNGVSFFHEIPV